ncbi:MAG TPA: hypothetical protein VFV58_11670 [Blastocatellia bacterium]|jgi:hypothetical protein|nr:hypothetical protein [Blastocatellia bacterium]
MNETLSYSAEPVTAEQKQAALEAVLRSNTFARADQLKSFLKYVCEMEIAGHGHELSEYLIGVEALGRPSQYSPGDDSAVRNRAFALRKKLQEFYEREKPDAPIRIELHKGSYCPHFVESAPLEKSNGNGASVSQELSPVSSQTFGPLVPAQTSERMPEAILAPHEVVIGDERRRSLRSFMAGVIITAIVAGAIYLTIGTRRDAGSARPGISPILAEAWGPILGPYAEVLICVANPPSFSAHSGASPLPASTPSFNDPSGRPMPKELLAWYKQRYPAPDDQSHFLTITTNATYWGDSIGAMTALKTLTSAGVIPQIFPEKVVAVPTLRRRNVILFGAPEYSPAVAHFLEKCPLTVKYLDSIISRGDGRTTTALYSGRRDAQNRMTQVYGLITVLPNDGSAEHPRRTVIFSGVNSAGAQAAAEFFSAPENLTEFRKRLNSEGHNHFPPAYQVVVSAETDDNILLNFKYETHRLLAN